MTQSGGAAHEPIADSPATATSPLVTADGASHLIVHAVAHREPVALDRPGVRVDTLVKLRWVAICGQTLALVIVGGVYRFPLPWVPALLAIAASAAVNLLLTWLYRRRDRLSGRAAFLNLGFDLVQLWVLIYLTGGLANPFALLLLVPVTIAATLLSARATGLMVAAALLLLILLWNWYLPLPWIAGEPPFIPDLYRMGILAAIALGMVFLAAYAWQVSAEGRGRQAALVATQAALERESRMGALGSFAAAAAHELGGPLGTMTLIARDLRDGLRTDEQHGPDVLLLEQEVARCRDILTDMSEQAEQDDPFPVLPVPAILREVIEPFEPTHVPVGISTPWIKGAGPRMPRSPELLHGLHNIVSNGLRHAATRLWVTAGIKTAGINGDELWLRIEDDGPGFPAELLPRLGEPSLGPSYSRAGSTGLGVFIATTLLERTGAILTFSNGEKGGARVELVWKAGNSDLMHNRDDMTGSDGHGE